MLTMQEAEGRLGTPPLANLPFDVKTPLWQLCWRDRELGMAVLLAAEHIITRRQQLAAGQGKETVHAGNG